MFLFILYKGLFIIVFNGVDVYCFGIWLNRFWVVNEYFSCVLNLE